MATPLRWYVPTVLQTVLTAGNLQSLATGSSVTGASYDNTVPLDLVGDFIFALQYNSITGIAVGTRVAEIYLLPNVDASHLPTTDGTTPQASLLIGTLESRAPSTSALEYLDLSGVPIPPLAFSLLLKNISGQALHTSALMFGKMQPYQMQAS